MRHYLVLGLAVLLGGCASERHFAADTLWPFGNPNAPVAASETAQRALGYVAAITPISPQAGNVWPGPVQPVPTLSDEQQNMTQPLGQAYTPSLPSPYPPGVTPPVNADLGAGPMNSSASSDGLMAPNVSAPPSAGGANLGIEPPAMPPQVPGAMGSGAMGSGAIGGGTASGSTGSSQ